MIDSTVDHIGDLDGMRELYASVELARVQKALDDARVLVDRYYELASALLRDSDLVNRLADVRDRPDTTVADQLQELVGDTVTLGFGDEVWERG